MSVLAEIFNIMSPNLESLTMELQADYEGLANSFTNRQ